MELKEGIHLAYCTNIHRGEGWEETFKGLKDYTLKVKREVSAGSAYAIGLRLGQRAAEELADSRAGRLEDFLRWLDKNNCYVFTINGFPYGQFHGSRVKEQVYLPDWTSNQRVEYTNILFDLLAKIVPEGISGSVSTLPGSFKEFIHDSGEQGDMIIDNLAASAQHVLELIESTGKDLHLGLEPEPLGWFETSEETVEFFDRFRSQKGRSYDSVLGVNYDTCHLAIEYEDAADAVAAFQNKGIRISKIHLSSALRLVPTSENLAHLKRFQDDVYLHQVIAKSRGGSLVRHKDLPDAFLALGEDGDECSDVEWRVHFHIPLHSGPGHGFKDTRGHIDEVLEILAGDPNLCQHLEMETYTWEVLPEEIQCGDVVEQLTREYEWSLDHLREVGLA